ncbi:uncharacterized protein LTR77_005788 [Saxophila tyrrhenica]|uniref:Integral membrane protein n=1 Tax=Saxophila tyrrhenica TaxID=1690608 RepID=A0AAV9PDQ3_9PEZI|nr:hypothetical protein LTR77_005788 [Saxophila tyrrhenica]
MNRSNTFKPEREPLQHTDTLQLNDRKVHGPVSFLNPTQARFNPVNPSEDSQTARPSDVVPRTQTQRPGEAQVANAGYQWTSRNNRKGRHTLVYNQSDDSDAVYTIPRATNSIKEVLKVMFRMFTYFPVWDISYLVAIIFTFGSLIWILNALFTFLPYTNPSSQFPGEIVYGGGITAFIGCLVFEIGCALLMLEAINENRVGCFGWALEQVYDDYWSPGNRRDSTHVFPSIAHCFHHQQNRKNFLGLPPELARTRTSGMSVQFDTRLDGEKSWIWFPSRRELRSHYFRDLGFLACPCLFVGMNVFCIAGLLGLPGIYSHLDTPAKVNGAYWIPQIIGGSGFAIGGLLFTIETQRRWWLPAPGVLGWHIGFWSLVGGVGFTIGPTFGLWAEDKHWAAYQANCSFF